VTRKNDYKLSAFNTRRLRRSPPPLRTKALVESALMPFPYHFYVLKYWFASPWLLRKRPKQTSRSVNDIPTEILIHIFQACLFDSSYAFRLRSKNTTTFSKFYRRWQLVTLGEPLMWTDIQIRDKRWAKVMILRSFPAPCSITPQSADDITVMTKLLSLNPRDTHRIGRPHTHHVVVFLYCSLHTLHLG
jgi:hypothetical protein